MITRSLADRWALRNGCDEAPPDLTLAHAQYMLSTHAGHGGCRAFTAASHRIWEPLK
ncbi:hypothetical protein [Nocardia sp. N2S4-5]|uniref:hypothetical protein n=1 Tax=Nocardia sp. N2S4-5 TaxID=3351565 RepID=UPI0037CE35BB